MVICSEFLSIAAASPDAVLLHYRGENHTYGAVRKDVLNFAMHLRQRGLQEQDRVGILLDNRLEYVVAYLGIQLAGGIVVALNPDTTEGELDQTLVHAEPKFVVFAKKASRALQSTVPKLAELKLVIAVDQVPGIEGVECAHWSDVVSDSEGELPEILAQSLGQIIYTSGTTGKPKGVALTHANLAANTRSILDYLNLTPRDSVFVVLPFYYSYGNSLLLTHLAIGARLVLASDFVFWNRALQLMQEQKATGLSGVPSTFAMLLHRSRFADMEFPELRYMTCAGGALAPAVVERLQASFPAVDLYLMYGQTEATARLSTLLPHEIEEKLGSIGKGIPGVSLRVLDDGMQPVAPGETGEIFAVGENIMHGYWRDKQASERVLTSEGLRTGDLATVDDDGYLFVVGRNSDMIKSGAYRINPQEIEEALLRHDGIVEVAVVGRPDEILGEEIVAYVVVGELAVQEREVHELCKQKLPAYKRPRRIEFITELPKTPSGKIRRAALRA